MTAGERVAAPVVWLVARAPGSRVGRGLMSSRGWFLTSPPSSTRIYFEHLLHPTDALLVCPSQSSRRNPETQSRLVRCLDCEACLWGCLMPRGAKGLV